MKSVIAWATGILPLLAVGAVQQGVVLTEELAFVCQYASPQRLSCDYRLITPEPVHKVSAEWDDHALPVLRNRAYPQPGQRTAVLVLVDSSAAQASALMTRRRLHLQRLFIAARPHHRLGVARCDTDLHVLRPLGSSRQELLSSLDRIGASQRPTALFRNTVSAIKLLAGESANRRALFIFSDGGVADQSYHLRDLVDRARTAGVAVYGVGYPQTPAMTSNLEALKRLSEESGGLFVSASETHELSPAFLSQPYQGIDNGAELLLDLSAALTADRPKLATLMLNFHTVTRQIRLPIPLAALGGAPASEFAALELKPGLPPIQNSSSATRAASDRLGFDLSNTTPTEVWLRYASPFAVGFLFLVGLMVYRAFKGGAKRLASKKSPKAFLATIDDGSAPYTITGSPWIIGRSKENDLTLNDNSVSRRHAELRRKPDGTFTITDLSSLNGLYVNNTKVLTAVLHDGDRIDIGDIRLRFVQH